MQTLLVARWQEMMDLEGVGYTSEIRSLTLLDRNGNSIFPANVSVTGTLSALGNLSVLGTLNAAVLSTTGTINAVNVSATGTISSPSLTGTNISVTGNVRAQTDIVATANLQGQNVTSLGQITALGSITAIGNVIGDRHTGNIVSVTGNITGSSLIGNVTATTANVTSLTGIAASLSGNITANNFIATSNGTGNNYAVGNDAFIGDVNIADTIILKGQANSANGYIIFGTSNNSVKV